MEFFEVLRKRHSIRRFKEKKIEKDKIRKLLQAANSAPSAGNLQAYQIILVKDKDTSKKLAHVALDQDFISQARVSLVFCADILKSAQGYGRRGETLYSIQDATISCTFVHLAAVDMGLGSVMVGAFDEGEVSRLLKIPNNLRPVIILPIGYPDEIPEESTRRSLDDLVKEI
ncbi:MAG: nitroreductase family protein [Candidatus Zixiibacteriota bacterium]